MFQLSLETSPPQGGQYRVGGRETEHRKSLALIVYQRLLQGVKERKLAGSNRQQATGDKALPIPVACCFVACCLRKVLGGVELSGEDL
jgi:hypothetical protein